MIEGALIFLGGWLVGVISRRLPPRRKPAPQLPAVCACGHARAFHDPQTNQCHASDRQARYNNAGTRVGYDQIPCTCRRYDGPEPISSIYAPPLQLPPD